MNKIISILLLCLLMNSCKSQDKISIDTLTFKENKKDFFLDKKVVTEQREINTTLPKCYTNEVSSYKYGSLDFVKSDENAIVESTVGVLLENQSSDKIVGIVITVEDTQISMALLEELNKINGMPEVLMEAPKENEDKQLLGYASYLWKQKNNYSIVLSQSFEYTDGKRNIASLLYIISNTAKVTNPNSEETVIDRLIRTYK